MNIYVKVGTASAGPSKKSKKAPSRSASSNTKKPAQQEKRAPLYQDVDCYGSFSDEDTGYVEPNEEDDLIVEATSPKPKAWPPVRSTHANGPSSTLVNLSGSDAESDRLKMNLLALRKQASSCHFDHNLKSLLLSLQIADKDRLTNHEDILDDMLVLLLSLTPPAGSHTLGSFAEYH